MIFMLMWWVCVCVLVMLDSLLVVVFCSVCVMSC